MIIYIFINHFQTDVFVSYFTSGIYSAIEFDEFPVILVFLNIKNVFSYQTDIEYTQFMYIYVDFCLYKFTYMNIAD